MGAWQGESSRAVDLSALHSVASEVASPGNADIWAWLKFLCGVLTRKSDIARGNHSRSRTACSALNLVQHYIVTSHAAGLNIA